MHLLGDRLPCLRRMQQLCARALRAGLVPDLRPPQAAERALRCALWPCCILSRLRPCHGWSCPLHRPLCLRIQVACLLQQL